MDSKFLYLLVSMVVIISLIMLLLSLTFIARPFFSKKYGINAKQTKMWLTIILIVVPILLIATMAEEVLGGRLSLDAFIYGLIFFLVVFILCLLLRMDDGKERNHGKLLVVKRDYLLLNTELDKIIDYLYVGSHGVGPCTCRLRRPFYRCGHG